MIYATIFRESFYRDGVRTRVELVRVHSTNQSATAASKERWPNLIETSGRIHEHKRTFVRQLFVAKFVGLCFGIHEAFRKQRILRIFVDIFLDLRWPYLTFFLS